MTAPSHRDAILPGMSTHTVMQDLRSVRRAAVELPIPATAHFIWLGNVFPWTHLLAVTSAARNGGYKRIVLHMDTPSALEPHAAELATLDAVTPIQVRKLEPEATLGAMGSLAGPLIEVYRRLDRAASQANVLRVAILYSEGGIYCDTDTITLRSLTPLRGDPVFCGLERICLPVDIARSRAPHVLALTGARMAIREACRRVPDGWRPFRALEGIYPLAANNAVLGASAGHPFLRYLARRMIEMPVERQVVRYALGTHLLQEALQSIHALEVTAHPPDLFYALAPEISEHWFKPSRKGVDEFVSRHARLVHWYASVRTQGRLEHLDRPTVERMRGSLPFAALACRSMGW